MIRFINCIRKSDNISMNDFRTYWHDQKFMDLIEKIVEFTKANRFEKNLTLQVEANTWAMEERGTGQPYDGVIEYWWDNAKEIVDLHDTPEAKALMEEMRSYQRQFIDFKRSSAFFTEA